MKKRITLNIQKLGTLFFVLFGIITHAEELYYSCKPLFEEIYVINLASNSKGAGWIDFQGSLIKTDFTVEGLEKRWDWLKINSGKSFAFVIRANGRAQYYDFTFADEDGFAKPRDTFECSIVQSNKLSVNKRDRGYFVLVSPNSFAKLGYVNYPSLNAMVSYIHGIKIDDADIWFHFVKFCKGLETYIMRRDMYPDGSEDVHTNFITKTELIAFLAHIDRSIASKVYKSASEFLDSVEVSMKGDLLFTSLISSIDVLPRGVIQRLNEKGGFNYCQIATQFDLDE